MAKKKEYFILIVIILGLGVYILFGRPQNTHYNLIALPEIQKSKFSKIQIDSPDNSVLIKKQSGEWVLAKEHNTADRKKIEEILDVLKDLQVSALVSKSGNYARYDLAPEKKIRVRAWSRDKLVRDFALGKLAPTGQHTFISLSKDNNVYHAPGRLRDYFQAETEDWIKKENNATEKSQLE